MQNLNNKEHRKQRDTYYLCNLLANYHYAVLQREICYCNIFQTIAFSFYAMLVMQTNVLNILHLVHPVICNILLKIAYINPLAYLKLDCVL